jgi:outer membrane protein OmpA-like peptidoglycan-associated protein
LIGRRATPGDPVRLLHALPLTAFMLGGCTEAYVIQGQINGIREIAKEAAERGAYRCAPVELALAEANVEFANAELEQGDQSRALEHLTLAEPNAKAALRMSPKGKCGTQPDDADGDGIPDLEDKCVDRAEDFDGVEDRDGCPEDQDTDGDGIADAVDLCVAEAEDTDGYLDADGCAERDNDADGFADTDDRCTDQPEDPDGFEDADGCPDVDNDADTVVDKDDQCPNEPGPTAEAGCPRVYRDVELTASKVVIKQQVFFETNLAKIRATSFGLLTTVAAVLKDSPSIRLEVQGHTDDRGNDAHNLKLSQERAEAVREYLIGQGIEPHRLTARGYGETAPLESNKKPSGRAANRRVEFVRTDDGAMKPPTP